MSKMTCFIKFPYGNPFVYGMDECATFVFQISSIYEIYNFSYYIFKKCKNYFALLALLNSIFLRLVFSMLSCSKKCFLFFWFLEFFHSSDCPNFLQLFLYLVQISITVLGWSCILKMYTQIRVVLSCANILFISSVFQTSLI